MLGEEGEVSGACRLHTVLCLMRFVRLGCVHTAEWQTQYEMDAVEWDKSHVHVTLFLKHNGRCCLTAHWERE